MPRIFDGTRTANVVVFFSGGASSMRAMLEDENHGKTYTVTGAYTDKEHAEGRKLCDDAGIPHIYRGRKEFYAERGLDPKQWDSRRRFYDYLCGELAQFKPDIICLSGYMHIVADPLLNEYRDSVLNVHPSDLTILTGEHHERVNAACMDQETAARLVYVYDVKRKFTGANAVYDAVNDGESETRSTVHIVTEELDGGPIVTQSRAFRIQPSWKTPLIDPEQVQRYANGLQKQMKAGGDGPAYLKALGLIATGRLSVTDTFTFVDHEELSVRKLFDGEKELPYSGLRLN